MDKVRVYLVEEHADDGSVRAIAVRLTSQAAWALAKRDGGRRVVPTYATRDEELIGTDPANQQLRRQHDGDQEFGPIRAT